MCAPETQPSMLQRETWGCDGAGGGCGGGNKGWGGWGEQANKKHLLMFSTQSVTRSPLFDEKSLSLKPSGIQSHSENILDFLSTLSVPLRYSQSIIGPYSVKALIIFY